LSNFAVAASTSGASAGGWAGGGGGPPAVCAAAAGSARSPRRPAADRGSGSGAEGRGSRSRRSPAGPRGRSAAPPAPGTRSTCRFRCPLGREDAARTRTPPRPREPSRADPRAVRRPALQRPRRGGCRPAARPGRSRASQAPGQPSLGVGHPERGLSSGARRRPWSNQPDRDGPVSVARWRHPRARPPVLRRPGRAVGCPPQCGPLAGSRRPSGLG